MSIVTRERLPLFHAIEKFSSFWLARFAKILTCLFHEEDQKFQQSIGGYRRAKRASASTLTLAIRK